MQKLPIGIQTFEKIREDDYAYVDKTDLACQLVEEGSCLSAGVTSAPLLPKHHFYTGLTLAEHPPSFYQAILIMAPATATPLNAVPFQFITAGDAPFVRQHTRGNFSIFPPTTQD